MGQQVPKSPDILAVDAGGTHCRLAYVRDGQRWEVALGPANATTNLEAACATIRAGLDQLSAASQTPPTRLQAAFAHLAVAGVLDKTVASAMASRLPLTNCRIEEDQPAAVRGALGKGDGVLAHCGTGSFFARQTAGKIRKIGGWGAILGDEASAVWLAKGALRATLQVADGRRPQSDLTRAIVAHLGGTSQIVSLAKDAAPQEIAALAPIITDAAAQQDPVGRNLMRAGAGEIDRALQDLGWQAGTPVCLAGGLGAQYAPYCSAAIQAALAAPKGSALEGALDLALDLAQAKAQL